MNSISAVSNKKMFLSLTAMGLLGVLTTLLMPIPESINIPLSPEMIKLVGFIQSSIFVMIAVGAGLYCAPKLGLKAPVLEAWLKGENVVEAFRPQLKPALIGGLAGGVLIVVLAVLMQPLLPAEFIEKGAELAKDMPVLARFFYGGITEEILMRWFMMSVIAFVPYKLFQKGQGTPKAAFIWFGIVVAALLFGAGHLPMVYTLVAEPDAILMGYIIGLNMLFGLIGGWLFYKKGLEAAILAHMMAHVVMLMAS